ncbi:MAG: hypothetical protein ABH883_01925 [Candidatus Omnitrophota bacterium]
MKVLKVFAAAAAVTVFDAIVGMVCCGGVFSWVYKLEPVSVWKPMEGAPGMGFFAGSFLLCIVLVLAYAVIEKGIPGKGKPAKGAVFGLLVWAVGMLPGMFATYFFMTVNPVVIVYWTILGLIQTPLKGVIISLIYSK